MAIVMIGCGAFAHRYHVPAIADDAALSIAAIFDPVPSEATRALAQRYAAPLVPRIDDLPQTRAPAFALVTTPHTLHAQHVDAMLDRGLAMAGRYKQASLGGVAVSVADC